MKNGPYTLVVAPPEYPGKKYRGRYVYEHRLVWWQKTGEVLPSNIHVHHENRNKRDNKLSNLESLTIEEHAREHANEKRVLPAIINCSICDKLFEIVARNYRYKQKRGQKLFYCSRSCQVTGQHKYGKQKYIPV